MQPIIDNHSRGWIFAGVEHHPARFAKFALALGKGDRRAESHHVILAGATEHVDTPAEGKATGFTRGEENRGLSVAGCELRRLPQGREIVENPEGAAVGGDDEVALFDQQIVDGGDW